MVWPKTPIWPGLRWNFKSQDVETIPEVGTWFQLINNGTVAINNGTNGLQRLDKVVEFSQKHGIYLLLSLTNNWSLLPLNNSKPAPNDPSGASLNTTRNILSNDYGLLHHRILKSLSLISPTVTGGMDVYVRQLGHNLQHDSFYTDNTIMNAFNNYISQIVSRYKNNPFILGWYVFALECF
jgi:mannan endo-1,4-beta-mannosidase